MPITFDTVLVVTGVGRRAPLLIPSRPGIAVNCDEPYAWLWDTHYST